MNPVRIAAVAAVVLALVAFAGCGAKPAAAPESVTPPPTPSPASTWTPAEDAFWSYVTAHTDQFPESSKDDAIKAGQSVSAS